MNHSNAIDETFDLSEAVLKELEISLSPDRLSRYLNESDGDREKAVHLYTWNTAVSAAFYGPLQALEVSLRNGMHTNLAQVYGPEWYDNPKAGLDEGCLEQIRRSKANLERKKNSFDPPDLIAALSFGFWVSLVGPGGYINREAQQKANYETTLWRPALCHAFPHADKLKRKIVSKHLRHLRVFRNRIAHHEPIYYRHLQKDYDRILEIVGWVSDQKKSWIEAHSRVREVLKLPKDANNIRF